MRDVINGDQLRLEYQPKVSLGTNRVVGMEALIRWERPSGEMVSPEAFLPDIERCGLMFDLTKKVLTIALKQVWEWRRNGLEVPIAINVSSELLMPGFPEMVAVALEEYRVPSHLLTLEITERVIANDLTAARAVLIRLNELGVDLAMDDFGTGWSSLLILRHLPIHELKLDGSFISELETEIDRTIVGKIIEIAHALGLSVTAEGIENEQLIDRLERLGCDDGQGWHIAKPMPASSVLEWVAGQGRSSGIDSSDEAIALIVLSQLAQDYHTRQRRGRA